MSEPNYDNEYYDEYEVDSEISQMFDSLAKTSEQEEIEGIVNERIVSGLYANEIEIEYGYSSDAFSPEEIEDCLQSYFRFFSKSDLDMIYMNFIGDKTQVDLQNIFHKTQPAISCTADRIKEQILIIVKMQKVIDEFLEFITDTSIPFSYRDRNILLVFFYSTSIIKTAQIIGINPMVCRARINSAMEHLKNVDNLKLYNFFEFILENLNKVKKDVGESLVERKPSKYDYSSGHLSQELPF